MDTTMTTHLAYKSIEPGLCRVYYRRNKALICFQQVTKGRFQRLICSADGEPIGETLIGADLPIDHLPLGNCAFAREFITWAQNHTRSLLSA